MALSWSGAKSFTAKISHPPPPSPLAKNGPQVHAVFASIVEATIFSNRQHQQGLVSERKQMNHDVPNEAYT